MILIRFIIIALIIYLLIQIFKRWSAKMNESSAEKMVQDKKMVRCDICRLHVPENEALEKNGTYYCCQEHYEQKKD